jgi:hypothetical protein
MICNKSRAIKTVPHLEAVDGLKQANGDNEDGQTPDYLLR